MHTVDRRSKEFIKNKILLEETEMKSVEYSTLEKSDIEELKKYLDDLLEMHDGYSMHCILITASFCESTEQGRKRRYEAWRQQELQKLEKKKEIENEPI